MQALSRNARAVSRHPGLARNSSGIFLGREAHHDWCAPVPRSTASTRRRASRKPMRAVVEAARRDRAGARRRARRTVGYGATWTAKRATRLAIVSASATRTAICAPQARADARPGAESHRRGQALRPGRARLDGSDGDRRHRHAGRQFGARRPCHIAGRWDRGRRSRSAAPARSATRC